jgi:hypothetical protein
MVEARDGGNRVGLLQRCADDLGWDTCEEAKGVCVSIQQKTLPTKSRNYKVKDR